MKGIGWWRWRGWMRRRWGGGGIPAGAPAQLPSVEETHSPQLQLLGRYAVGVKQFLGERAPPADALLKQIDQAATNPIDEFRAIPVVAELSGDKAALQRLDAFERNHTVVRLRQDVDDLRIIYSRGVDQLSADRGHRLVERHGWFGQL